MKFEEVLPALKSGKKIRRKCRPSRHYHIENNHIFNEIGDLYTFGVEADILQDDWEIVKEKKQVKLRDLTEEQFNKWAENNCTHKYGKYCIGCPFDIVNCSNLNDNFRFKHKDLFSDKFLDQEVEIEGD